MDRQKSSCFAISSSFTPARLRQQRGAGAATSDRGCGDRHQVRDLFTLHISFRIFPIAAAGALPYFYPIMLHHAGVFTHPILKSCRVHPPATSAHCCPCSTCLDMASGGARLQRRRLRADAERRSARGGGRERVATNRRHRFAAAPGAE
eukprot:729131-Prorocentrum_minimum.AAC.2